MAAPIPPIHFSQFTQYQAYEPIYQQMREYTSQRIESTPDAVWFLEHFPVFTQGQAGKAEHILDPGNIPIIQSDRGGQVTYHGPGQLMIYTLFDLKRLDLGIKSFVQHLQKSIIELLKIYGITANLKNQAPGVYIKDAKICSIGLRVRQGCTYHGLSLNVNMDLTPFSQINPCGFRQLKITQIKNYIPTITLTDVIENLRPLLLTPLER
jgi:lipoyl(octanoyl) transferase